MDVPQDSHEISSDPCNLTLSWIPCGCITKLSPLRLYLDEDTIFVRNPGEHWRGYDLVIIHLR